MYMRFPAGRTLGDIIQTQGRVVVRRWHFDQFGYAREASCPATSFCMVMNTGSIEVIGRSG